MAPLETFSKQSILHYKCLFRAPWLLNIFIKQQVPYLTTCIEIKWCLRCGMRVLKHEIRAKTKSIHDLPIIAISLSTRCECRENHRRIASAFHHSPRSSWYIDRYIHFNTLNAGVVVYIRYKNYVTTVLRLPSTSNCSTIRRHSTEHKVLHHHFNFFIRGQFWPSGIFVSCVCLSVC